MPFAVLVKNISSAPYSSSNFITDYGIHPKHWIDVKSLAGCKSDRVPGIAGVGEITALKYIRQELPHNHKTHQRIQTPHSIEVIKRNRLLVELPFPNTPITELIQHPLYAEDFRKVFSEYNFQSFLKYYEWEKWVRNLQLV